MKGLSLLALLGLGCLTQAGGHPSNDYENNDYYVLRLNSGIQPRDVARRLGLEYDGQLASLEDHHVFLTKKHEGDLVEGALEARRSLRKRGIDEADVLDSVRFAQKQVARKRLVKRGLMPPHGVGIEARSPKRYVGKINAEAEHRQTQLMQDLHITDPIFPAQWHLFNTIELGHDINVTDVWRQGITGHNVSVCIVDDGLDQTAGDLKDNYFAAGSWDFNGGPKGEPPGPDPIPRLFDDKHGTRCAGEVAAGKNDFCGLGVAYNAKIAGVRILSAPISDKDEAAAMIYALDKNHIYSCSWGPPDDGKSMDAPGILIKSAMLQGIQKGREGKGAIYIFASGNGANFFDNCNFDGYTNSIYSLTIGAVDRKGIHPFYAEKCSAQLVVTYSSGSGDAIHTTDKGSNTCTDIHGGTSAAAPLAAGIVALMLEARPDLTWRDVQAILMETAIRIDSADDWETTAVGRKFSHTFGYGKIDTYSAVEHAKKFKLLKPQSWYFSPWVHVKQPVPQGTVGIVSHLDVSKEMLVKANLDHVEHVTVTMNVNHTRRGDLSVNLISPAGVVSHLAEPRELDDAYEGYVDWTFMSVAHW
jgi:kexin